MNRYLLNTMRAMAGITCITVAGLIEQFGKPEPNQHIVNIITGMAGVIILLTIESEK